MPNDRAESLPGDTRVQTTSRGRPGLASIASRNSARRKASGCSRRSFLKFTGVAAATAAFQDAAIGGKPRTGLKRPLNPQEFKNALAGPILSLPTTFNEDLTVNHDA